jgi:hypothetical protein
MLWALLGAAFIFEVLLDAFETIILPRRVPRQLRIGVLVPRAFWRLWCRPARHWRSSHRRETYLGFFGPSILIVLIAIWAAGLVLGFALLLWRLGAQMAPSTGVPDFGLALYGSGTTISTLGLGDA